MLQPEWKTSAGDLGTYPSNELLNIQLSAVPQFPANQVFYKVLAGSLPPGLSITLLGNVTGTPTNVSFDSTNTFTIRATDNENNIRDRTFSLTISGSNSPKLTTLPGSIITTVDSVYINYKLQYTNPISSNVITAVVSSGSLPPGLYLTDDGVIKGYPDLPKLPDNSPTTKTHTFSIQLKSDLGSDLKVYSITIRNQQTNSPPNVRIPVILNRKPLSEPISTTDPYYDYYLLNGRTIPTIRANEYFSFKIIGRDFDTNEIVYQFGGLPPGLVGDSVTGWITGIPVMNGRGISQYEVNVSVAKKRATALVSAHEIYYMTVSNEITEDITWVTDSDLGTILNGTTNALSIKATSMLPLSYYWRKITLGSIETAIATDNNGTILYEVVYSKVIDDLSNSSGISVTNKLFWPRPINLRLNAHTINNTDILTSSNSISTTSTPSTVNYLYPASLENMRNESNKVLTQNSDSRLLPKWMTTQQANSNTLGFVQAWIICYTKPGKAVIVKDLIDTKWGHKLNEIDLTIDRYYIDRSSSYNWNTNLAVPAWTGLPSSTPVPDPIDKYDFSVLFPRKTILPDNSQ